MTLAKGEATDGPQCSGRAFGYSKRLSIGLPEGQMGRGELQVKTGQNGNVELTFKIEGKDAVMSLSPDEVSALASHLLAASYAAFTQTGKSDEIAARKFEGPIKPPAVVTASGWHFGQTNVPSQRIIIVRTGEAAVTFTITPDRMRSFGRVFIQQSWKNQTNQRLFELLLLVVAEFLSDLKGWGGILIARFRASSRRYSISLWSKISGRSLRLFRTIKIGPDVENADYDPVGECIYCGAKFYSEKPNIRRLPLGAEHIIAEGLGADLELPAASCMSCEAITGAVEGGILGRTLKSLRVHLGIRGKKRRPAPMVMPLTKSDENKNEENVDLPSADYPVIFNMPAFGVPGVFMGGPGGNQAVYGFRLVILNYDQKKLLRDYGVASFASVPWDTHLLFRMLAKIGHALAVAELGKEKFTPSLLDLITKGNPDYFNHIGGQPDLDIDPTSKAIHELGLGYQRANGKDYVVAKIRLFAKYSGPIYYVVVGESLEGQFTKFTRLFSRRISAIFGQ